MAKERSRLAYTFYMLTIYLCGALLFLFGFFPASYSVTEEDSSVPVNRPTSLHGVRVEPPPKSFDSIVLFVIDALRDDFPNAQTMPTAHSRACERLSLHVDIPTVTMPRLKTMTTGTLSNFIDIALNIGHTEQLDDSLLHRLKRHNLVAAFAGDRTWSKLFPSEFKRKVENVDSFFVNDFNDGDKKVTAALQSELANKDWDVLVLHYLGLDHIGHVEGNESPKVPPKLKEMDEVLRKIVDHENVGNYFVMMTGDHGMANGGGHGGNTPEETTVPFYLFFKNCSKPAEGTPKHYNQIDMAPTLAILLSVEIPKMSIGCLIPEMMHSLTLKEQLYAYFYNAHHLLNRARVKLGHSRVKKSDYYTWYQNATLLHKQLLVSERSSSVQFQNAKLNYMRAAKEISNLLSESLVKFDYGFIAIGLALTVLASLHTTLTVLYLDMTEQLQLDSLKRGQLLVALGIGLGLNIAGQYMDILFSSSLLQSVFLVTPITISIYLLIDVVQALLLIALPATYSRRLKVSIPLPLPLLICLAIRTFTLGSSSFIEREYKTWYYLGNSMLVLTALRTLRRRITKANVELDGRHLHKIASFCLWQQRKIFVVLILLTLMRYLHHLLTIQASLMLFSLFILWNRLHNLNTFPQNIATAFALLLVYIFRGLSNQVYFFDITSSTSAMRRFIVPTLVLFWCCVTLVWLLGYRAAFPYTSNSGSKPLVAPKSKTVLMQLLQTNLTCSILVAALLHKPRNVILLPVMLITLNETYKLCDAYGSTARKFSVRLLHVYKIILTIFVARMFHFYQGNSNSLATIDLTPGYIGQTSYNPVIVGLFVTLNTYCAEIHSFIFLIVHTLRADLKNVGIIQMVPPYGLAVDTLVVPLYAALTMLPAAFYLCLMVGFRYHLFIYSVFSPKVLYDCYTVLVFYLVFLITSLYFKLFKQDA